MMELSVLLVLSRRALGSTVHGRRLLKLGNGIRNESEMGGWMREEIADGEGIDIIVERLSNSKREEDVCRIEIENENFETLRNGQKPANNAKSRSRVLTKSTRRKLMTADGKE